MRDEISQAICEMVTRGIKPAAIVMTPTQLKRFMLACSPQDQMYFERSGEPTGTGWTFEGLPIWRSWHLTGPCVLSREVFRGLRRGGTRNLPAPSTVYEALTEIENTDLDPFLF